MGYILGYPPFLAGDIRSCDVLRPIANKRKDLMDFKLQYLSTDIICFKMQTVFQGLSSRKIVGFGEQIISKDKYLSNLLHQIEATVFIILQMFIETCTVLVLQQF